MNKGFLWMGVAASGLMIAWAGCGGSGGGGTGATGGAGTTTTTTKTTTTTGTGGSSAVGGGGSGGAAMNPFECTVPTTPPSGGSCVTTVPANDAGTGNMCNPVTNEGCAAGEACDISDFDDNGNVTGFECFPPPNDAMVCQTCDDSNGPFCGADLTCFPIDSSGDQSVCAQYCCTDADCGAGKCSTMSGGMPRFGTNVPNLGLCTLM